MNPIFAITAATLPVLLLGSCRTTAPEPERNFYAEHVSGPALERRLANGELAIGLVQSPGSEKEFKNVSGILERHHLKLKVIYASRAELPPLLRSGTVDLIAGEFTEKEIRDLHLVPVLPSADGKNPLKKHVFAIRRGNPRLEQILSDSPSDKEKKENGMVRKAQN